MSDAIAQFASAKYLNLETFRRSGAGVRTPVWFALEGAAFYVYTLPDSGKVKRIRNNSRVRIAPCDIRGNLRGAWVDGVARITQSPEAEHGQELLRRRYGWMKIVGDWFSKLRGRTQVVLAIELG